MNGPALSLGVLRKIVEISCARCCCFSDPVNGEPGLKRPGEEQTGHHWVHAKGVRVLTKAGAKSCMLCVCMRKTVGVKSGIQPITHKHGTLCGGMVVIKDNNLMSGSEK